MIKKVIKTKSTVRTNAQDGAIFESAFRIAVDTHGIAEMNFKTIVSGLQLDTLTEMKTYIDHDKTKKELKITKLCGMMPPCSA